jgi:xanthine dehydrogenase accessory factor
VISADLEERLRDLRAAGAPFVTATVVRTQRPTSVLAGSVALIGADGAIDGFVGGVCAQHSVRLYALQVIESGAPMMLRIDPDAPEGEGAVVPATEEEAGPGEEVGREEGIVRVRNPCLSGGTIELFLEPVLPAPRVVAIGDSPIVAAMKELGPPLGLEVVGGTGPDAPTPMPDDLALVVASHGRDEPGALKAGLEAGVPYVGLVGSVRRGAAVLDEVRGLGVAEELVARIETPAGAKIKAATQAEIALSILARIVEVRRSGEFAGVGAGRAATDAGAEGAAAASASPRTATDPICGMTVVVLADTPSLEHDGETVYFCCEGCRDRYAQQQAA